MKCNDQLSTDAPQLLGQKGVITQSAQPFKYLYKYLFEPVFANT